MKIKTQEYANIQHSVLSLPRKIRDMLFTALAEAAEKEDHAKAAKVAKSKDNGGAV